MKQKFTAFIIAVFSAVICFSINCFAQDYTLPRFEELDGKRIAIETGTTYDDTIIVTNAIQNADFRYYQSLLDCLVAVSSGNADALALDTPYAAAIINSSDEYRLLNGYLYEDEYGFVLKKNSPLTKEFNRVIAEMKNDGTIDRLFEKWTSADQSMKVLTKQDWEGSRGTLTFCTLGDSEPVAYQINSDEVVGFDVDIAVNIAKRLDYKLIVKVTDFSSLVPAVDSGRADFVGGSISITDERKNYVDFSIPYFKNHCRIMVRNENYTKTAGLLDGIKNSFVSTFVSEDRWKMFCGGIGMTVLISVFSILFGMIFGFAVYMLCRSRVKAAEKISKAFVWIIHATPEVVLLMIMYYIIFKNSHLGGASVAIITFTVTFGAAFYSMIVSGVDSVNKGQVEAALSLGYRENEAFFKIILPQAAYYFLPSFKSEVVSLLKSTAIVGYIAVEDLTKISDIIRNRTYDAFFPIIAAAVIYFIISGLINLAVSLITAGLNPRKRKEKRILKGVNKSDRT